MTRGGSSPGRVGIASSGPSSPSPLYPFGVEMGNIGISKHLKIFPASFESGGRTTSKSRGHVPPAPT